MLYDDAGDLLRILAVGALGYAGLILLLRISGKRTLAKMNAFDLAVTVAVGSTLSALLLTPSVSLAEGLVAFAVLFALQYAVAFASSRSSAVRSFVKAEPALLLREGRLLHAALRDERVSADEVMQALRAQGHASIEDIEAVVLETDGTFSVIGAAAGEVTTLRGVPGS